MKVYVAGPMRGYPNFNFAAFHAAEVILEKEGHEVFNPARRDENELGASMFKSETGDEAEIAEKGFSLREALHADTEFISLHADAVCVLDGWEASKGARAEVALAEALGLPVYTLQEIQMLGMEAPRWVYAEESGWQPVLAAVQEAPRWGAVGMITKPTITYRADEPYVAEEVRETSASGAMKGVKLARFDLLPVKALTEVAKHYGRTAGKYPPNNWRKGFEWSKSYAAIMRHLTQWWDGEDVDVDPAWPEGSPHLAAVAWHALTLLEYIHTGTGIDDRPE